MATTYLDIITGALRLLNVVGVGETVSAEDSEVGKQALGELLEQWSNEGLSVYQRQTETFSFPGGSSSQTFGPTGDFVTTRPIKIESSWIRENGTDYPVEIITDQEYQLIADKSIQSNIPHRLYYQGSVPDGRVYLWPVPSATVTLGITTMQAFSAISDVADDVVLPPGYAKALRFNLAVDLAPEFAKSAPPEVISEAEKSRTSLRRINLAIPKVRFDSAIPGVSGCFDIYTGEYR